MKNSDIHLQVCGILHEQFHIDTLISFLSVSLQSSLPIVYLNISPLQYASMLNDCVYTPTHGFTTASWRLCSSKYMLTLPNGDRTLTLWCSASLSYPLSINMFYVNTYSLLYQRVKLDDKCIYVLPQNPFLFGSNNCYSFDYFVHHSYRKILFFL